MKLIVKCQKCRSEIKFPHKIDDRLEYAKNVDENFTLSCSSCNTEHEYHVDNIVATDYTLVEILKNRVILYSISFVAVAVISFFFIGSLYLTFFASILIPFILMIRAKSNDSKQNLEFNRHKVRGRPSGIGMRR
ncbi:hypothetical protein FUAX_06530 [Fulvitalea axinellae]|uniref:Cxxc_20_cxxc protein n=1 Tax=Fulvitalea axinellae TaxID=1182444 RepID=A0AAU9CHH0_9BACT|nr:hypothetical protein FUAX_06530 [Fulvitalea axinellae]